MKKLVTIIMVILFVTAICFTSCTTDEAYKNRSETLNKNADEIYATSVKATSMIPTPQINFFVERDTLAKWAERWDKPSVVTYVYLFTYGNCIGYYVCNGKPAATTNYLIPEYQNVPYKGISGNSLVQEQTMDLDGTYGANNPGIRFFTASGIAVEWAGQGASYLYSDAVLPLNVPKLGE